jgi:hydrogenase maturation factor
VTKAVTEPVAVVSGLGKAPVGTEHSAQAAAPGQDVVISKWIGLEGTALLARRHREKCLERYPAYLVDEAAGFERYLSLMREAATAVKSGVCAMHDASEGGIFGALWELAEGAGVGLTIDLKKLPLKQETVEICELCNVNPYELLSGGSLVMTTADGPGLVAALVAEGIPAVIVGKVTKGPDRILLNEEEVRYMDKPKQDAIYADRKHMCADDRD